MTEAWELHEAAMDLLNTAALYEGNAEKAHNLTIQAFELEREAALAMTDVVDISVTRSSLFYGAITLALKLDKFKDANDLAKIAQQDVVHKDYVNGIERLRIESEKAL
jgi:hypothetical protein